MKRAIILAVPAFLALLLIAAGARRLNIQQRQYELNRHLINAIVQSDVKQALALVNAGADPNTRYTAPPRPSLVLTLSHMLHGKPAEDKSPTALMLVCGVPYPEFPAIHKEYPDDAELVASMIAHGAKINLPGSHGRTALLGSESSDHSKDASVLLEHGAAANTADESEMTPLMWAVVQDDSPALARELLAHGAKVNVRDVNGESVLMWACKPKYNLDTMRLLLKQGANPSMRDVDGNSPLTLAQDAKRPDVVALFRNAGRSQNQ